MASVKGIAGVFVGLIITMLVAIILINGIISNVDQSGWTSDANETWSNLQTYIWTAFGLLVIIPLVIGAVIIMRMIGGGGRGGL